MYQVYHLIDDCEDKNVLGYKGASLVSMTRIGVPVPPGFVISTNAYHSYRQNGSLPLREIKRAVDILELQTGKMLGHGLSVSVRSSAPASMPGAMDTLLDIRQPADVVSAIKRVFDSWDSPGAQKHRHMNHIPADLGTAAIVQAMVFGDLDTDSGAGVIFTRDPASGEKTPCGEFLIKARGEALASGRRSPKPIGVLRSWMPDIWTQLEDLAMTLENHFGDMQEMEFTIEAGCLYVLQTRPGGRSSQAALKIAMDMAREGLISRQDAVMRISPGDLKTLLHRRIESPEEHVPIARGQGAAPGAATGMVVFQRLEALQAIERNEGIILVRPETSAEDIQGISAASGVVTLQGGLTSHAALVTRSMGKPCICGAGDLKINVNLEQIEAKGQTVRKGDVITIDGNTGSVYLGALPLVDAETTSELAELLSWADEFRQLGIRANADTVEAVALARSFGAEGIGLFRTERQFDAQERLSAIRAFILGKTMAQRAMALDILRRLHKEDFIALFRELEGMPIIIRLLDKPLGEFLPSEAETSDPLVRRQIRELHEANPMLGHRGVRLAVTSPEIYRMQIEAIAEARAVVDANVSVMVPQVITPQELLWVKKMVNDRGLKVGVMMETVRACLRAGRLARVADFFSFGTNDLTQAVYSFSREDAEREFLPTYLEAGILKDNPFQMVDIRGVGRMMDTAVSWARIEKPDLEIGVCGEHAGDPRSIHFFQSIGVDYISCSPFRLPVARLAAAQAAIEEDRLPALDEEPEATPSDA